MNENTEHGERPAGQESQESGQRRRPAPRDLPRAVWDGPAGAWLRARGEELVDALLEPGEARLWIHVAAAAIAVLVAFNLAAWWFGGTDHALASLLRSLTGTVVGSHLWGLAHTTTHAVSAYLRGHAHGLPVTPTVLYAAWQLTGLTAWLLGLRRSNGPRLLWGLFGAATGAMVFAATPAPAQGTAAGVWALTWGVLTLPLLRGLSFRTVNNVLVDARPQPAPTHPAATS
jgi:hypothetical protein